MAEITLERTAEILLLRRPRVTTTAMVMTPRTTAYSAIVWPDSSLRSANRRLRYSIKEIHLLRHSQGRRPDGLSSCTDCFGRWPSCLRPLGGFPLFGGTCRCWVLSQM